MSEPNALEALPAPQVIEELDFETILASMRADLLQRYPEAADVLDLESEPLNKLMQVFAYRELLFRARVNEVARSNLLALATGTDLDHKGAFYGLARMPGESDDRYRVRIQLRIASLAANGTAQQYRLLAMSASLAVRDAAVRSPLPGRVSVVLWLADGADGAAVQALVDAALNAENARPLGVPVTVSLAAPKAVHIAARLWREASAPTDLVAQLAAALPAAVAAFAGLGRALPRSWVTARLHVAGIARVEFINTDMPPELTAMGESDYPVIGTLDLRDQGVA